VNPWAAIAQAFVYPVARAWADAWFDARRQDLLYTEEAPNATDVARTNSMRDAYRMQHATDNTGPEYRPQDIPKSNPVDPGEATTRKLSSD
jgi:hypothetical protein